MGTLKGSVELLSKRLEKDEWRMGEHLPQMEELARQCDVSRATMWKVIQILKKKELIETKRGGYIVAGKYSEDAKAKGRKSFAWERLRDRLGSDLSVGRLSGSRLLPITKLANQYDVSVGTVRKALTALLRDNQIDRIGNSYKAKLLQVHTSWQTVVLITHGNRDSGVSIRTNRNREVVEAFERDRLRQGFSPLCLGFEATHPDSVLRIVERLKEYSNIAGFVVNPWDLWDPLIKKRWFDLIEVLLQHRLPLIVLDHEDDTVFPPAIKRDRRFRSLRIAGQRAGEMVARYLCESGYTKVAFVASLPNRPWVHQRFAGMERYLDRYGEKKVSVKLFEPSFPEDQTMQTLLSLRLTEKQVRTLYREKSRPDQIQDMVARYRRNNREETELSKDPLMKDYRKILIALSALADTDHTAESLDELINVNMRLANIRSSMLSLRSRLMDQVSAYNATIWVCSDEFVSYAAYHYLREKKVKVPEQVALFGFENWQYTHEYQISAYDFNMTGLVQKALACIFDKRMFAETPTAMEVDGYIVNRRTTRRKIGLL